jgi:LysM repeat protein
MSTLRLFAPSLFAVALASCASQKADSYDTPKPYNTSADDQVNPPLTAPENPVYDTPAAYEESTGKTPAPEIANIPTPSAGPVPSANAAAIIHTVVKGDTLSGISSKYKIPVASIKRANRMTNDTVVLDRKMVIPPR